MQNTTYKIGIVGASSLMGKELNEALGESLLAASDFVLMDDEEILGQLESVADEVTFVQRIEASSFEHMDFAFFAGRPEMALKHWQSALHAGANIIDLTYALESEAGTLVRAPWVMEVFQQESPEGQPLPHFAEPNLKTTAILPAHPAALMLALVIARLHLNLPLRSVAATVLEPASQYGRAAMDELHQQTVSLLSFQNLPREQYDAQTAFNLLPVLGEEAKIRLAVTEERIRRHYALLSGGRLPALALQLAHAPAFHGYIASLMVELAEPVAESQMEAVLQGEHIDIVLGESDPPSNLSAAGQDDILIRMRPEPPGSAETTRYWLWIAADNLKLSAMNAIACAQELRRLRPQGKVQ
ncbi:MAG: Asd/ArgC dimerization domain-containing protein [Acidobacteriaceae bacterium]